jgi:hypothetical protein
VRNRLIFVFVMSAFVLGWAISLSARQTQGAAPPQGRGNAAGRAARPRGPAGPLPRLPDGHPDLTGIWNGFGGSGGDAPNMLPWAAEIVARHRANNGAEDFEADLREPLHITRRSLQRRRSC